VYVQNLLQQLQAQPFPAISLYTYLESMGIEDVEAEIDRIGIQLEDPRFHPDRMTAAVGAMEKLGGQGLSGVDSSGLNGGVAPAPPGGDGAYLDSMAAAGVPGQAALAQQRKV
jgi:hypothetical protein